VSGLVATLAHGYVNCFWPRLTSYRGHPNLSQPGPDTALVGNDHQLFGEKDKHVIFDFMSYKAKIAVAVIATLLCLLLIGSSISVVPTVVEIGGPLWLIVVPLALTIFWVAGTVWLWQKALQAHASATGKLYPGEKLARQLLAEHGGELIYNEPGTNIRKWSIAVEGADGFRRTLMTTSGKEVR
jgi:hypothetical protein